MDKIVWLDGTTSLNDLPQLWIPEYRKNRYLRLMKHSELQARTEDILSNMLTLGDDRKYRPRFLVSNGIYRPIRKLDYLRMLVHAWDELQLRGRQPFDRISTSKNLQLAERFADESWCSRPDWVKDSSLSQTKYETPQMLFKFSEAKYNRDLFHDGALRLQAASGYSNPSMNNAQIDNELVRRWYSEDGAIRTFAVDDYYCTCFSGVYDLRLFRDFREADFSCVAIKDVSGFIERVRRGIERHNEQALDNKISELRPSAVFYYDPFFLSDMIGSLEAYFSKHFRFAYQEEFRLVAIPAHSGQLDPIMLSIGGIADIAELIVEPSCVCAEG